jgi:hypothetical protein
LMLVFVPLINRLTASVDGKGGAEA